MTMKQWLAAAAAGTLASLPLAYFWGFSVDDAWIVTRVVQHGLESSRFAFNPTGPVTDAITPYGYAQLVAGATRATQLPPFLVARLVGVAAALGCLFLVSARVFAGGSTPMRWVTFVAVAWTLVPFHAWAGAGLETPIVALLVLLGLWGAEGPRPLLGAFWLSLACAWRPELVPVSVVGLWRLSSGSWRRRTGCGAVLFVVPAIVAALRWWQFGSLVPLAFVAKAPDPGSGLRYALGGLSFLGVSWLLAFLPATRRVWTARVLLGTHAFALLLAGGDWMPFFRLYAPLLPWLCWAVVVEGPRGWRLAMAAPFALAGPALLVAGLGSEARAVIEHRFEWIERGRPLLEDASVIAAVDIGWLGQATSAEIVDLAGVTDPRIARLSGSHTDKALSPGLFAARNVDAWVIRAQGTTAAPEGLRELSCVYSVDQRLLGGAEDMGFVAVGKIAIPGTAGHYVVARLKPRIRRPRGCRRSRPWARPGPTTREPRGDHVHSRSVRLVRLRSSC